MGIRLWDTCIGRLNHNMTIDHCVVLYSKETPYSFIWNHTGNWVKMPLSLSWLVTKYTVVTLLFNWISVKKKIKTLWILKMLEASQSVYWPTLTCIRVGERRALANTFSLIALRLFAASDKVLVGMFFCLLAASLPLTLKADGNDFLLILSFLLSSSEECWINNKI